MASYLARWGKEMEIPVALEQCESGESLLQAFAPGVYDVIFLDVFLTGIDGMKTAKQIREADQNCCLIFTTTTPEFAVDSYEVAASWYLLKPYSYDMLKRALSRCAVAAREQYITIPGRYGPEELPLSKVAWTEYEKRRVHVHFVDGNETWALMTQKEFLPLLLEHPGFCDCMKGLTVHFPAVEKLLSDSFLLRDGQRIPISRLKYRTVREQFLNYSYEQVRGGIDRVQNC